MPYYPNFLSNDPANLTSAAGGQGIQVFSYNSNDPNLPKPYLDAVARGKYGGFADARLRFKKNYYSDCGGHADKGGIAKDFAKFGVAEGKRAHADAETTANWFKTKIGSQMVNHDVAKMLGWAKDTPKDVARRAKKEDTRLALKKKGGKGLWRYKGVEQYSIAPADPLMWDWGGRTSAGNWQDEFLNYSKAKQKKQMEGHKEWWKQESAIRKLQHGTPQMQKLVASMHIPCTTAHPTACYAPGQVKPLPKPKKINWHLDEIVPVVKHAFTHPSDWNLKPYKALGKIGVDLIKHKF